MGVYVADQHVENYRVQKGNPGAGLNEARFRSNIAIEGAAAWEEQGWLKHLVQIGGLEFLVTVPVFRCLATHANPHTGLRDAPVLTTLASLRGADNAAFAVAMTLVGPGGRLQLDDALTASELP